MVEGGVARFVLDDLGERGIDHCFETTDGGFVARIGVFDNALAMGSG